LEAASSIQIINLEKKFGQFTAVNKVSLDIRKGEFITLLGPSGSGKTTTLMMIAGFVFPTAGDIQIGNQSIISRPAHKRNIGMVFQHYSLFPHMTAFENVAFPLKMRKFDLATIQKKVQSTLELVELDEQADRYPKQLSGGQQQRVALARALVFNPPILLMDEPLGALDKKLRESMQLEIKRIQEKFQITTVYVTHDQSEALTMSDRIAIMNKGRIVQLGAPEQLYENPASRFVAGFIGKSNFLSGKVTAVSSDNCRVISEEGLRFVVSRTRNLNEGDKVTVAIRPEKLVFIEEGEAPSGWNSLDGIVEEFIYLGDLRHYEVSVSKNDLFLIQIPSRPGIERWQRGSHIKLGWKWEDAKLV